MYLDNILVQLVMNVSLEFEDRGEHTDSRNLCDHIVRYAGTTGEPINLLQVYTFPSLQYFTVGYLGQAEL